MFPSGRAQTPGSACSRSWVRRPSPVLPENEGAQKRPINITKLHGRVRRSNCGNRIFSIAS